MPKSLLEKVPGLAGLKRRRRSREGHQWEEKKDSKCKTYLRDGSGQCDTSTCSVLQHWELIGQHRTRSLLHARTVGAKCYSAEDVSNLPIVKTTLLVRHMSPPPGAERRSGVGHVEGLSNCVGGCKTVEGAPSDWCEVLL